MQSLDPIINSQLVNFCSIPNSADIDSYCNILEQNIISEIVCMSNKDGLSYSATLEYSFIVIKDIKNSSRLNNYMLIINDKKYVVIKDLNPPNSNEIRDNAYIKIYPPYSNNEPFNVKLIGYIGNKIAQYKAVEHIKKNNYSILKSVIDPTHIAQGTYVDNNIELHKCDSSQLKVINSLEYNLECIHGAAGTGKSTTIINIIVKRIPKDHIVLCTAVQNQAINALVDKLKYSFDKLPFIVVGSDDLIGDTAKEYTLNALYNKNPKIIKIRKSFNNWSRLHDLLLSSNTEKWPSILCKNYLSEMVDLEPKEILIYIKCKKLYFKKHLHNNMLQIIQNIRVFLCTTSVAHYIPTEKIDTIIVDEAGSVTEMEMSLVLKLNPKNLILIGDHKQLLGFTHSSYDVSNQIKHNLSFFERSLLNNRKYNMLTVQYRMGYKICNLVSKLFYDNRMTSNKIDDVEKSLLWFDIEGNEQSDGTSYYNNSEVELIKLLCTGSNNMVLSPYNAQISKLKQAIKQDNIKIKTIDCAQGSEDDKIIISLVRSNDSGKIGFCTDMRRLCVLLSRAKYEIWIVGDYNTFNKNRVWSYIGSQFLRIDGSHLLQLKDNFISTDKLQNCNTNNRTVQYLF
jgi:hypothetical protein